MADIIHQNITPPATNDTEAIRNTPETNASNTPRSLFLNLSLASPEDLKIKPGMQVTRGQIISDRAEERRTLDHQRQTLQLSLKQIESHNILSPKKPPSVPTTKDLPPKSYAAEESAISDAELRIKQAEQALQLAEDEANSEPLAELFAVSNSNLDVQDQQNLVDKQLRNIDTIILFNNSPPEVFPREQEKLKQIKAKLEQKKAKYKESQANLKAKKLTQAAKLQSLAEALNKARAEHELAIAHLQAAKHRQSDQEYEASITEIRQAEERNQLQQNYDRQVLEAEQQQRDRDYQIAQLKTKIAEVDEKLSHTAVTSLYNGTVREINWKGRDRIELTLDVADTNSNGISQNTTENATNLITDTITKQQN